MASTSMLLGYFSKLALLILASALVAHTQPDCQPSETGGDVKELVEIEDKFNNSQVIVMGKVISATVESDDKAEPGHGVYTVEFEVYCAYKGAPVKSHITIKNAGFFPEICLNTTLEVGKEHFLYLKKSDGYFIQITPRDEATSAHADEIFFNCEAELTYPSDMAESQRNTELCAGSMGSASSRAGCPQEEVKNSTQPISPDNPSTTDEKDDQDKQLEAGAAIADGENGATTNYISIFGLVYLVSAVFYL